MSFSLSFSLALSTSLSLCLSLSLPLPVAVLAQAAWAQASCCAQVFSGRIAMAEVDDIAKKSRQWGMVDMHDHLSKTLQDG